MPATALRRRIVLPLVCLLAFAVGGLGGCGDDDPAPGATATSPPPTTTAPATTLSQADQDEAALRQLTHDWYETVQSIYVDQSDPELAEEFITGEYLSNFLEDVEARRAAGMTSRRGQNSREAVTGLVIDGDAASIDTCNVDANVLLDADGEVVNDEVATFRFTTSAERTEDGWIFTKRIRHDEPEDGAQCVS